MIQEPKQNYNSLIGFLLMGGVLLWFMNTQKPNEENNTSKDETHTKKEEISTQNIDPNKITNINSSNTETEEIKGTTLFFENDFLKVGLSSKGGYISYLEMKNHKTYRGNKLLIIDNDNSSLNINLNINGKVYNTSDIVFSPSFIQENDSCTTINMTSNFGEDKILEFSYTLNKNNHIIDYNVNTKNISLRGSNLKWHLKGFHTEKSLTNEDRYTDLSFFNSEKNKKEELSVSGEDSETINSIKWVSFKQQFFSSILLSESDLNKVDLKSKSLIEEDTNYTKDFFANIPLDKNNYSFKLFFVPNEYKTLKGYGNSFDELIPLGWGIFGWVNKFFIIPIFNILTGWGLQMGIAILVLTLIVKLLLSPITYKNFLSSAKMRVLKPEIEAINEKHKNADPMKKQQATMELYNKAGVNPLAGCIPMLLQMPILFAMFRFFPAAIELRGESFLWAEDLSSYDSILNLGFDIPFYGDHISLFTLLMSLSLLAYTHLSGGNMDQPKQPGMPNMKVMMYMMPFMMIIWFNDFASGLTYYYFLSNIIGVIQMIIIKKFVINEEKIMMKIQENKKKDKPKGKWQKRMEELSKRNNS